MTARLSRNTFTLLVSNLGSAALSFLLSVLIGRALGQDGLGVYAAVLAWVFPLSLVAEFGLGTLITREVAQSPESGADYLRATSIARLWLGGGLTLLLVLAAPVLSEEPAVVQGLQVSAPLIVILPFFGAFSAIFRARQVMWPVAALNLGMLAVQVSLTALVLIGGGTAVDALTVNTGTSAGQMAAAWLIYRWRFQTMPISHIPPHELVRRAWPFALAAILAAVQLRIGIILLEQLAGKGAVGYYAAASRFAEAGRLIPNALFGALFPLLATLAANRPELRQTFNRVISALGLFGLVLAVMFTLIGEPIITLTYGESFAPALPVLQVTMWALLPALLRAGQTLYWYALGQEQFVNRVTALTLIVQIGLSLWLIPQLGALGVAFAGLIIEILAFSLLWQRKSEA